MPKKQDDIIEPIDADFEDVAGVVGGTLPNRVKTLKNR